MKGACNNDMKKYTIKETAELLNLSKHTLRYYDEIGVLSPNREHNGYRYYSEADLFNLKYIEVMKYANFTLAEIKLFSEYKQNGQGDNGQNVIELLERKKRQYQQKIENFQALIILVDKTLSIENQCTDEAGRHEVNTLILGLFDRIKGEQS